MKHDAPPWALAEEALLRLLWPWVPTREMSAQMGRSVRALQCKASAMKLGKRDRLRPWSARAAPEATRNGHRYRIYTDAQRALVQRGWLVRSIEEMAAELNTTASAVRNIASNLCLEPRARAWSTQDERWLMRTYGRLNAVQVGVQLGRGEEAIRQRVYRIRRRSAAQQGDASRGLSGCSMPQGP